MNKILAILSVLIGLFIFSATLVSAGSYVLNNDNSENLCYEYEAQGYIPKNSCYCSTQLFDSWDESYNWVDACAILKAKDDMSSPKEGQEE